jgi:hypothetical protein
VSVRSEAIVDRMRARTAELCAKAVKAKSKQGTEAVKFKVVVVVLPSRESMHKRKGCLWDDPLKYYCRRGSQQQEYKNVRRNGARIRVEQNTLVVEPEMTIV